MKMNKVSAFRTKSLLWATNVAAFFSLPNPRILAVFIISSTATVCLGIAMLVERSVCSKQQPGFQWILYYAPALIAFPIFVWLVFIISANFLCSKDQKEEHTMQANLEHNVQPQQVQELQDRLALVPTDNIRGEIPSSTQQIVRSSPVPVSATESKAINTKSTKLERTYSLRLPSTYVDYSNLKRTFSFRL